MYNTRWNHRCALPLALLWYMCIFSNQEDQVDKIEVTFHTSDNVRIETTHPTATKLRELNMSPKLLTNYATLFAQTNLSTIQHQEAIQQIRVHVPPKLGEVLVREGFSHVVIRLECESIPLSAYGAECQDCDDSSIKVLSIFDSLLENESSSIEFISAQVHTLEAGVYVYMEDAPAILEMHFLNEIHDHVKFTKVLTLRDTDDMKDFIASQRSSIHPNSDFKILVASESDHHIRTEFISTDINSVVEVKFSDCTRYASMYKKSSFKIPMADEMHKQLIIGGQIVIKLDVPIRIIFEHREARSIFRLDNVKNCVESAYMRICKFLHVVENFSTHTLKAIMIQVLDGNEWGLLDFFVFSFTPLSRNFIEFKNFLTVTNGLNDVTASGEVEEKNLSDILSSIDEDRKHKNIQIEELFVPRCNELNSINEVIDFVKNHYPAKLRELENENHDTSRVHDSSLLMVQMQNLKTANLQLSKVNGELSNLSTTMKTLSENIQTLLLEGKTGSKKIPKELDIEHIKITTLRNDVTSLSSEIAQHESSFTEAMQNVSRRRITHDASLNALEEKCDELQNRISQKTPQANSSSALPAHTYALISLSIVTFLLIVSLGILVYLFRGNFYNKFHRVNIKHEHCTDLEIDETELEELYEREIQFATM